MNAFDDLTLGEVEVITNEVLGGKSFGDVSADPMMVAGGVMWMIAKRTQPDLAWLDFKANVRMGDIKAFSIQMEADQMDPTNDRTVPAI